MIDALGAPESVLLVGGSSEIGTAIVHHLRRRGRLRRVSLAGRPSARLDAAADELRAAGVRNVDVLYLDVSRTDSHAEFTQRAFAAGDLDVVVMAAGVLPDQAAALADPAVAVASAQVNYVGPMSVLLHVSTRLRAQGHGVLVVLSSVAAERPRWANFVYGSAKAGLDAFATGLGDQLIGRGIRVLVVRPGFVPTRMTAGLPPAPMSSSPDDVGAAVAAALSGPTATVWVPGRLRWVMSALRHLPRPVFRRLPR
ncbi:MAG: decaprenylphospho-beta-D-erythro-pentofuranosid-2-ulose 2-reductase [bacterium]